jgi:hypothetical protein
MPACRRDRDCLMDRLVIMAQPTFALGVADARAGRGFPNDYDLWDGNDQWGYERGRLFGVLAPRSVPVQLNGKINPAALKLCARFNEDIP